MGMSHDEVRRLARLARLRLSDQEVATLAPELDAILGLVRQLQGLDTNQIEPVAHVAEVQGRLRPDEPGPMLPREAVLANAPLATGEAFLVPKAVER